ncbi:MAG TPA: hypothetical protein VHL57_12800 [Flavobacteriales bacterium]|jgi:hypothetical protein|nr:hypothetical protein [Flavobacteriales bacterium]
MPLAETSPDLEWAADELRVPIEDLSITDLREGRAAIHRKYHPDRFGYLKDEALDKLLHDVYVDVQARLRRVEAELLRAGMELPDGHVAKGRTISVEALRIEVVTQDKELKYRLFRTRYLSLDEGRRIPIPGTGAFLVATSDSNGREIGFQESIRMFLTYHPTDPLKDIVIWLYLGIAGHVRSLWIDGERVEVDPEVMYSAIAKRSLLT